MKYNQDCHPDSVRFRLGKFIRLFLVILIVASLVCLAIICRDLSFMAMMAAGGLLLSAIATWDDWANEVQNRKNSNGNPEADHSVHRFSRTLHSFPVHSRSTISRRVQRISATPRFHRWRHSDFN